MPCGATRPLTLNFLINGHARLMFSRNKFHPTRKFSCNSLKIPSYPSVLQVPYPLKREVRVLQSLGKEAEVKFCRQENTIEDKNFKAKFVYFTDLINLNLSDKIFSFIF